MVSIQRPHRTVHRKPQPCCLTRTDPKWTLPHVGKHRVRKTRRELAGRALAGLFYATSGALLIASTTTTPANADVNWDAVAACESGGNWGISTGNGFFGGLQFTLSTWRANGGTGMPNQATRAEQIRVANNVLNTQGIGAWPICGKRAGTPAKATVATKPAPAPTYTGPVTTYTVQLNDTLANIATTHHTGWEQLYAMNRGTVTNPNLILPGQTLKVPA